jgi:hypothetical protein
MPSTRTSVRRLVGLAGLLTLAIAPAARAQSLTFAAFRDGGAQTFEADNVNGTLTIAPTSSPVTFDFSPATGLPAALLGDQAAHMVVSYQPNSGNPATPTPGSAGNQPLDTMITVSFLLNTPYQGYSDLLTVQFTGLLTYTMGGAGNVQASVAGAGNAITYSSDFLTFADQSNDNLSIALNAVTPIGSTGGFTASQLGSFAAFAPQPAPLSGPYVPPSAPVPPSAILLSLGLLAPTLAGARGRLRGWASKRSSRGPVSAAIGAA